MRVTLLIDHLGAGGAQRQASALHQAWIDQGIDARLVYYRPQHHFLSTLSADARARVTYLETSNAFDRLRAVQRHLAAHPPDVVLSFLTGPTLLAYVLDGLLRPQWKWVVSERSALLTQHTPIRRRLYVRAMERCDLVVPNSVAGKDELMRAGIPPSHIRVMPNGLSITPDMDTASPRRESGTVRLLMVGTISAVKNHAVVLSALAELKEADWTLDLVGRTTEPDVETSLRAMVNAHGLEERVRFHGRQSDVGAYYATAHALLLTSTFEGFPNVILEAWAWGCPPIVNRFGDLPELVGDGVRGLAVDVTRPGLLRDMLRDVLADPQALQPLAEAGYVHVREEYPVEAVAQRWTRLLEQVVTA